MQCKNPGVVVYRGNAWECANCGSIACGKETDEANQKDKFKIKLRVCECGAEKTLGKDTKHHALWCNLYQKP